MNNLRFSSRLERDLPEFVATKDVSSKMAERNENTEFVPANLIVFVVINGR